MINDSSGFTLLCLEVGSLDVAEGSFLAAGTFDVTSAYDG